MNINALVTELHQRREGRGVLLLLDYDGTLVEIAPWPEKAVPTPEVLDVLSKLVAHQDMAVSVVSGRPLQELLDFLPIPGLNYVGSHGGEGRLGEWQWIKSTTVSPAGEPERLAQGLASRLADLRGWRLEQKPLGIALHFRQAEPGQAARIRKVLTDWMQQIQSLGSFDFMWGRKVLEVLPQGVSKGTAVRDILSTSGFSHLYPIYLGDDVTDESAFQALKGIGLTIKVGDAGATTVTAADHSLADPAAVLAFLTHVALFPEKAGSPSCSRSLSLPWKQ